VRRPAAAVKPRTSRLKSFPAPTGGWIANRNLAVPNQEGSPQGAAVLDNFFPTSTNAIMRRGSEIFATLGDATLTARALFSYVAGSQEELFAATDTTIYNISSLLTPVDINIMDDLEQPLETDTGDVLALFSTLGTAEVYEGQTSGDWSVVQFATTGGIFLFGVNGVDPGFIYDGTAFYPALAGGVYGLSYDAETIAFTVGETLTGGTSGATAEIVKVIDNGTTGVLWLTGITGTFQNNEAITDSNGGAATADGVTSLLAPAVTGILTSDLSFVWSYKNRLFFVEKDSLDAWYLPVDQIGGALTKFPLGGVFPRGGSLLFGATWSLDSGASGGLSEQCVFITTEGEVAVYQGTDPSDAAAWSKVGVYRIGKPLGKNAWIRAGGDLVIATSIGFVPLSQAIQRDYAALSPSAVSYPIEEAWNETVLLRGDDPWHCEVWPESQLVAVAPPNETEDPVMYVANARTGAWARYTGWRATCMEVWRGRMFFGSTDGLVLEANVTGADADVPYTAAYIPLFDDIRQPASLKIGELARATMRSSVASLNEKITFRSDFDETLATVPDAPPASSTNEWGTAIWGESVWGASSPVFLTQKWKSIGGTGYAISTLVQITSGSVVPLDAELIRLDVTYQVGDYVT
jgi:hypothetical protein